ncbi:Protein png1 [Cladophialophora chaetospira]|uniref:Protein png1 n=1 Tax=Cladophialophora chaetospira TaxID=386627 RepID=A0AA39CGW4_9EURO|nr:Protein png1 [Cladophialophora chaetospira]
MPWPQRSIAVACERLTTLCLRQLQWLSSQVAGLEEDLTTFYLWAEGFKDGRLHDIAIFSPALGLEDAYFGVSTGASQATTPADLDQASPVRAEPSGEIQNHSETEKFRVGLLAAKEGLEMASLQDAEDDDLTDNSDPVDDEIRQDLTFQIRLLMQLVPSMDRMFSQTLALQQKVATQGAAQPVTRPEKPLSLEEFDYQTDSRGKGEPSNVQAQKVEHAEDAGSAIPNEPPPPYGETYKRERRQSAEGGHLTTPDTIFNEDPPIPKSLSDPNSFKFFRFLLELSMIPAKYENPGLLDAALTFIPTDLIYADADAEHSHLQALSATSSKGGVATEPGYLDCVIRALLGWFRRNFFAFVYSPPCTLCASPTVPLGAARVTAGAAAYGAQQTERYQCTQCLTLASFPRDSDVWKLLGTKQGRREEFANCFAMLCRAMGARVRLVWSSDKHRWVEVYSEYQHRWIHVDPCDEAWDRPLLYTQEQNKRLAYCIAFSHDGATDVTRRYVRDPQNHGLPRTQVSEEVLYWIIHQIRKSRRDNLSKEERTRLLQEDEREEAELGSYHLQLLTGTLLQELSIRKSDAARRLSDEDILGKSEEKFPDRLKLPWEGQAERHPWEVNPDDPFSEVKTQQKFLGLERFPWEIESEDHLPTFVEANQKPVLPDAPRIKHVRLADRSAYAILDNQRI